MWASNSCLAMALDDDNKWSVTWNASKTDASNAVLQMCRNNSGKNCTVKVAACTSDPR
jgi:hypothetical protein